MNYKHCIIKSKDDTIVCLVSEVSKPTIETFEYIVKNAVKTYSFTKESLYNDAVKQWLQSFKEYPMRKEDVRELLALIVNVTGRMELERKLSEGIEIDPSLVEIKFGLHSNGDGYEFAILKQPKTNEVESDDWDEVQRILEQSDKSTGTNITYLKSKFTIKRNNSNK